MQVEQFFEGCACLRRPTYLLQGASEVAQSCLTQPLGGGVNGYELGFRWRRPFVEYLIFGMGYGQVSTDKRHVAKCAYEFAGCKTALLCLVEMEKPQPKISLTVADQHLQTAAATERYFTAENLALHKRLLSRSQGT